MTRSWSKVTKKGAVQDGTKLPFRSQKGAWLSKTKEEETIVEPEEDDDQGNTNKKSKKSDLEKPFETVKLELASIASILGEAPEQNMKKLGELVRNFSDPSRQMKRPDGNGLMVVQLGLLTTLTVLQDLMPGYAIRALSEEEQSAMVSKEVKAVRAFEQSYLSHYRSYLQRLQKLMSVGSEDELYPAKFVAYACLCGLLKSASDFNCYEDIVKWTATGALGRDAKVGEECCSAIVETFREDQYGKATCMIIHCLSDIIKDRDYQAPSRALATLLQARIRTDIAGQLPNAQVVKAPKSKKNMSKRDKKEMKKRLVEIQKISDAEALVSKEEQEMWYSDALRYTFRIYFGILKRHPEADTMPEVLRGLAHFAHLISQDEYFGDLLRSLKAVTVDYELGLESSLQCILTVARIQALQEKALSIDIKFIYTHLFKQLGRMATDTAWHSDMPTQNATIALLREVLKALLGPRLHLSSTRLASFAQKLADLALALVPRSEYACCDVLALLQSYLDEHKNVRLALLDRECFGQGAYMPGCPDPDMCNPYSRSICVPLDALQAHQAATPKIKSTVGRILAMAHKQ